MLRGTIDIGYYFEEHKLAIVQDIKSSVYAVKDMAESLQLHGYSILFAKKMGADKYITGIWDASDSRHYFSDIIEVDSFEYDGYLNKIQKVSSNNDDKLVTGTHCGGCWSRMQCPSYVVQSVEPTDAESRLLAGKASPSDVIESLQKAKILKDRADLINETAKAYTNLRGPVLDVKTNKIWGPVIKSGKKSLNQNKIKKALNVDNLNDFLDIGSSYTQYSWKNNK